MLTKSIRVVGLILIFAFSAVSIFLSLTQRDVLFIERGTKTFSNYTSYFEDRFYDLRMGMTFKDDYQSKDIVFAKIDEPTLEKYGRRPMSRKVWAQFLDKLQSYSPKVVVFDVFFPEKKFSVGRKRQISYLKKASKLCNQQAQKSLFPIHWYLYLALQNE